jgi:hypothetical protein
MVHGTGTDKRIYDINASYYLLHVPTPPKLCMTSVTPTRADPIKHTCFGFFQHDPRVPPVTWYSSTNRSQTLFDVLIVIEGEQASDVYTCFRERSSMIGPLSLFIFFVQSLSLQQQQQPTLLRTLLFCATSAALPAPILGIDMLSLSLSLSLSLPLSYSLPLSFTHVLCFEVARVK